MPTDRLELALMAAVMAGLLCLLGFLAGWALIRSLGRGVRGPQRPEPPSDTTDLWALAGRVCREHQRELR